VVPAALVAIHCFRHCQLLLAVEVVVPGKDIQELQEGQVAVAQEHLVLREQEVPAQQVWVITVAQE
jgi:hypothetical protein